MIGGQAKGWRGGERGDKGVQKDDVGEEEKNREKELDGPFFLQSIDTPFVSLAHSDLHTQYAAAVW